MKKASFLAAVLVGTGILLAGCAEPLLKATEPEKPEAPAPGTETVQKTVTKPLSQEEKLEQLAVKKLEEYHPAVGEAVTFEDEDRFHFAVYPKVQIDSYQEAVEQFPDVQIPEQIGQFEFTAYLPYSSGFPGEKSYGYTILTGVDRETWQEGIIPLPESCGAAKYGVHYQTPAGKLLVLSVNAAEDIASESLLTQEVDGQTIYMRHNQPYTVGAQLSNGTMLWLSSVFPEENVIYNPKTDPRAELPQEELIALLLETTQQFETA